MIKTIYFRFLNIVMLLCLSFSIFSCINYLPCEGQDYVIDNSTPKELINKLNLFRVKHPEYSASIDHFNKDIPHYYIEIYFKDLKTFVEIDINTYKENLNSQIFLNFSKIKKLNEKKFFNINSKEIDATENEFYKKKFELEILNKLNIKWHRKDCM